MLRGPNAGDDRGVATEGVKADGPVRVGVLGAVVLDTGSGPTAVGGARLRALLARLAIAGGRPVSPAALVEDLWGEPGHLRALQSLVSRLRGVLGGADTVASGPEGYWLAVGPEEVDALRFDRLVRAARQQPPVQAAATLRAALGLWRGPALADVRGVPFAAATADRLERSRLAAVEDRIAADLEAGTDRDLVAELESLTAEHPLREGLQAQLIRALASHGRSGEALAAYQRVRGLLADTFGTDPGPRLQEAHVAVLRGELPGRRPTGNLEVPLTSFVGRADAVRRVVDLLGRARLVTLVGVGGAGKTRLATAVGRQLARAGEVWLVPLASSGADDVPRAVYDVVRVRGPESGSGDVMARLVEVLAADNLLLVLDNCEHVAAAAAALAATLLTRCPGLRILTTGREPLHIDGEHLHPVPPLQLPEPDAPTEQIRAATAIQLFCDRAVAVRPDFVVDGTTLVQVAEICRRLDGLPLAIELAAARLRTLPLAAVAARLDDRFGFLVAGSRIATPRHQTLQAVVAWSWDLLEADERMLLERLAVIPGSFGEDAAAAVGRLGRVPELLLSLLDKSLLQEAEPIDPAEPRYRMLQTIREYGLRKLADRGEADAFRARHASFLLELAETADPRLRTSDQLRWLARLSRERDNLSAAIRWAVDAGDADLADSFGVALFWFWFLRDNPAEALPLLDPMVRLPGPARPEVRRLVVLANALAAHDVSGPGEAASALDRIRDALDGLDAASSHPMVGLARLEVAIGSARELPKAGDLGAGPEPAAPWDRSFTLLLRGVLAVNTGNVAAARGLLSAALAGFEALGERWGIAITLNFIDLAQRRSGEPAVTPALTERATRYLREIGNTGYTLEIAVRDALHRAEAGDVGGGDVEAGDVGASDVGASDVGAGDVAAGRRQLTDLLGVTTSRAVVRLGLARLELRAGRIGPAREHAQAGLVDQLSDRPAPRSVTALLLAVLALADAAEGAPDEAAQRLDHPAVHLMLTLHTPTAAAITAVLAAIELDRDRAEQSARLLGAAGRLGQWDDLVDIDAAAMTRRAIARLGAARFAAVHAEGAEMSRSEVEELVSASFGAA